MRTKVKPKPKVDLEPAPLKSLREIDKGTFPFQAFKAKGVMFGQVMAFDSYQPESGLSCIKCGKRTRQAGYLAIRCYCTAECCSVFCPNVKLWLEI